MTVISTVVTDRFTAHASNSFITVSQADGTCKPVSTKRTKLIRVPAWRGAMAYWGLATRPDGWDTLEWLNRQAEKAGDHISAEAFAKALGGELQQEISRRSFTLATGRYCQELWNRP